MSESSDRSNVRNTREADGDPEPDNGRRASIDYSTDIPELLFFRFLEAGRQVREDSGLHKKIQFDPGRPGSRTVRLVYQDDNPRATHVRRAVTGPGGHGHTVSRSIRLPEAFRSSRTNVSRSGPLRVTSY